MSPSVLLESALLDGWGRSGTVVTLLVCGHMLADFVFQTRRMVEHCRELRWLLGHTLIVIIVQALCLLPVASIGSLGLILALGISHAAIDATKERLKGRWSPLRLFVVDQLAHLAALAMVAWVMLRWLDPGSLIQLSAEDLAVLTATAALIAAYAFNGHGAGSLIEMILKQENLQGSGEPRNDEVTGPSREARMGRKIGILERYLILTLILLNQWEAIGLILAAKSLARFKELEDRGFSEYYLVGTLLSVLLALATGMLVQALL